MDILDELEFLHLLNPKPIYLKVSDAIVLERLISDKLYRAMMLFLSNADGAKAIVKEALESYEMVRSADPD